MFYYYGAKNRLAKFYPAPLWDTIIEPFAGSAGYSQFWRHEDKAVILFDQDERVVDLWHSLQAMSADDIMALPTPVVGEYYPDSILDMLIKMAAASNGVAKMAGPLATPKRVVGVWDGMKRRMAKRVDATRDWIVVHGDYADALTYAGTTQPPGTSFTWFIDPPYQTRRSARNAKTWHPQGEGYRGDALDYEALAVWVKGLPGQVIVCEQVGAEWLDFIPLRPSHDSQGRAGHEAIATW